MNALSVYTSTWLRYFFPPPYVEDDNNDAPKTPETPIYPATSSTSSNSNTSLMHLPDDILYLLLTHISSNLCSRHTHCDNPSHHSKSDFLHLTMTNRRMRQLAAPLLFRTICLGRSWSVRHTLSSLHALQKSALAAEYVRELRVDLWVGSDQHNDGDRGEMMRELQDLGALLAESMAKTAALQKLSFSATKICGLPLEEGFLSTGLMFPQIGEVKLGHCVSWMVGWCPNLRSIASDDWLMSPNEEEEDGPWEFMRVARKAKGLKHFEYHARWRVGLLEDVWRAMPDLESVSLSGGRYLTSLEQLLDVLRRFERLKKLKLMNAGGVHFSSTTTATTQLIQPFRDEEDAARLVFGKLPRLDELVLGKSFRAWVTHRNAPNGRVEIRWEADVPSRSYSSCHGSRLSLAYEDTCTVHDTSDQMSLLSDGEDVRSMRSLADTLGLEEAFQELQSQVFERADG